MKLSIIIPAYNENATIGKVLKKIQKLDLNLKKEIIVIDDCSTDGTKESLLKIKDKRIRIYYHSKNKGKGTAIRTGLKYATGDIITIQDADLEYDPNYYKILLRPILNKQTKVVFGSRFLKGSKPRYHLLYFGNLFLSFLTSLLYNRRISDMETCYKVFTKDVIENIQLKSKRFDFEAEITAKIIKKGYKIKEVPITYFSRSYKEGKKITWKDGVKAALGLIKWRFIK